MKQLLLLEFILTGIVFTLLFFGVDCKSVTRRLELLLSRLEKRPLATVFGLVVLALLLRLACLGFFPPPEPRIHDEFSYLLAADTFAMGRLSNPTHLHWQFFESFHINQIPTYASMYPPAQGLVLAAGGLAGHPWIGVLISTALMCGVLCWMLQGWLPARWALIGGLISIVRISLFSYWGNSYWGGSVAAIGGLLVLGSIPRILKKNSSVAYSFTLGLGVLVLANSRPFEGLLLCVAAVLACLTIWLTSSRRFTGLPTNKWLAVVVTLIIGFTAMAFYNWRVTGSPSLMPYTLNQRQYAMARAFLWQAPVTDVEYRHQVMKDFYTGYYLAALRDRSSIGGLVDSAVVKVIKTWLFFIGPVLSFLLIASKRIVRDRRIRLLLLIGLFAIPGILAETWFHPHYMAPFIGIAYVLMLQGMRHIHFSRLLSPQLRLAFILTVPVVLISMTAFAVITFPPPIQDRTFGMWCCNANGQTERSGLISQLHARGGQHLILVEYGPKYAPGFDDEWVYNAADIDHSPIVFARYLDATKNSELIQYFHDRQVWHLIVDHGPVRIEPYVGLTVQQKTEVQRDMSVP